MGLTRRPYGPDRSQFVEDLRPARDRPATGYPVVVLLHGGFWRARYGRRLMAPLAQDLVRRGWATWNVEYRRLGIGGGWPQTYEDVQAALALLDEHAEGLDLRQVFAVGHSAGGHLALHAARTGRLAGVVAQGAVCDLAHADALRLGDGVTRRFGGGDPDADPMTHAPTGVPTLLVHGGDDELVPPALSERYAAAAGAEATLEIRPGEGHFEHLDPASGAWASVVEWLARARDVRHKG